MNQQSQEWESWMQSKMIPRSFNFDIDSLQDLKNCRTIHPLAQLCLNSVGLLFLVQNKDWNRLKNELIGEPEIFISKVNGYDVNRINRELYDELEKEYTSLPDFDTSEMKKVSLVIAELAQWVLYMRDRASYKFKDMKPFQRDTQGNILSQQPKEKSLQQQQELDPMSELLSRPSNKRVLQSVQSLNEQQYNDSERWFQVVLEQSSVLDQLRLSDFQELKALTHPSQIVQQVGQAVGVLLQLNPNDWASFKKELQQPQKFLDKLNYFESNDITYEQYSQLKKLINEQNFAPEIVNQVSKAAVNLSKFALLHKNLGAMIFQDFKTIKSLYEPNPEPLLEVQQPVQEEAFDPAVYYPQRFGREFSSEELDYVQQLRSQIILLPHNLQSELRSIKIPNQKIVFIMDGVIMLLGEKYIDWKQFIGQIKNFIEKCNALDVDSIPQDRVRQVYKTYVSNPLYDFEVIQRVSAAAAIIAQWVSSVITYLRFAYNVQDQYQNEGQQKNQRAPGTPVPKRKMDINRLQSAKTGKSIDPFAKSNDKYYQKMPIEKTIGFYEVDKGYQATRARSPTTKLAAGRNSTIQKSTIKPRDKSPLFTPVKLSKSVINIQQITQDNLKQMSRDDKITLLNSLNKNGQQSPQKDQQIVNMEQKRVNYNLAINKKDSQDIQPKTGQRETLYPQGEKAEGKAALVAQEDQLNHQEVISYLKVFLETHRRVQDPVDDMKAIFDKIVEWKSDVRQRLSGIAIHNVRSVHRKFSEFKDEIGLTNDEVNLIMFSAVDEDEFNNLLIQSAELTAWFRTNFKGESQQETDFLNDRARDLEQCVDFAQLVISEYNQMQDKNQVLQNSWWQNIRFKELGDQLRQKFSQNPGLQSKILSWFQQHDEKISYYHLFQFLEKDCGIKSKNYVERMLEKRLDPHSSAFISFIDFYKFTSEYGIQWSQGINPQEDLKFEKKMHKLENQSYIDYKVTKKDYFMGCPTMLTSEKAALAKCYQIYEETTFKLAQGQRAMLFFDQDFGPKRKTDLEGCKKAMYKTGEPPSRVHPDPNQTEWVFIDTLCKPGEVLKFVDEGFSSQDALQGLLGDCYFITALSQLALREDLLRGQIDVADLTPGMIIDADIANQLCQGVHPFIFQKYSQIGLYVIRFFKNYQWIYVLVDQRIPVNKTTKKPIYGHCRNINELWIPLIEKAYAKLHGCYENLVAGFVDQAIQDLTSYQPERLIIQENQLFPSKIVANMGGADGLWNYLKLRKYDKSIMSCSIKIQGKFEKSGEAIHDGVPSGLLMNHSYGLLDLFELNGIDLDGKKQLFKLVVLRNPHGRAEWKGEWSTGTEILKQNQRSLEDHIKEMDDEEEFSLDAEDGIFLIPYQNFIEFFTNLYINIDFSLEWSGVRFNSNWTQDNAAGLPTAYVSQQLQNYARNPQFYMQPANDTEVVLSLGQTGGRLPVDGKYFNYPFMETLNYTCAAVFELKNDEDYLTAFDKDRLLCITPICCELENTIRFSLQAGHQYVIVCSTEIPNRTGNFFLNVFFNCELRDMEIVRIFHPNDRNLAREQVLPELIPELAEHRLTHVPNWKLKMINDQLLELNQSEQKTQLIIDGQVNIF